MSYHTKNYLISNLPDELINHIKSFFFTPKNYSQLKKAVKKWVKNKDRAIKNYGHISLWNTSKVKNMIRLFKYKKNFNDDISL